jgi:hypothetical protein
MNPRACRYVLFTLGLAGALVGGLGLLNYWVDPYNRFGNNRLGVYISAERESKSTEVRRYPHNALLLGNSRMAMIPADQLTGFRFFNGAFGGATAEEIYYFAAHYARHEQLVVLGVDLLTGDPSELHGDIFAPPGWTANLNLLLNLSTVEYSFRTIAEHLSGHPASLRADGSFEASPWFALYDREDRPHLDWEIDRLLSAYQGSVNPSKVHMTFLLKLAECLRQRGIACVVVVPPLYETVAQRLGAAPGGAVFAPWLSQLKAVFPNVVDLSFSPYCAVENFFKCDPVHFKPAVGVQMLNVEVLPVALRALQEKTNPLASEAR